MTSPVEIIKRKRALEKEMMSSMQTSLSMVNTSILFLISSIILIKLFPGDFVVSVISFSCLILGSALGFFSIYYFRRKKGTMSAI